jgi:hypothetical protein
MEQFDKRPTILLRNQNYSMGPNSPHQLFSSTSGQSVPLLPFLHTGFCLCHRISFRSLSLWNQEFAREYRCLFASKAEHVWD